MYVLSSGLRRSAALFRARQKALSSAPEAAVDITSACAARLKALSKARARDVALRVTVDGGGCSGFQYVFTVEDMGGRKRDDNLFQNHGAVVVVDDISLAYIAGAKVDYVEELISSSFRVSENPNSDSSCGCGVSFAAKSE